jgi:hypothetical protein
MPGRHLVGAGRDGGAGCTRRSEASCGLLTGSAAVRSFGRDVRRGFGGGLFRRGPIRPPRLAVSASGLHKASGLLKPFLRSARRSPLRSTLSRQASQVPPHPLGTRHRNLTNRTTHRQNFRRFRPLWRHPTPLKRQNIVGLLITWSLTRRQLFPVQNDFLRSRRHDQSSRPCDWCRRAPALPAASRRRAQVCVRRIAGARAQCGWKPRCWPSTKHPGRCSN